MITNLYYCVLNNLVNIPVLFLWLSQHMFLVDSCGGWDSAVCIGVWGCTCKIS